MGFFHFLGHFRVHLVEDITVVALKSFGGGRVFLMAGNEMCPEFYDKPLVGSLNYGSAIAIVCVYDITPF